MVKLIIVEKGGNLKAVSLKECDEALFYKKCSFRNDNYFDKRHTWKLNDNYVSLYAKNNGRANTENKYDLPPPLDNELYFGKMLLVKHTSEVFDSTEVIDLTEEDWQKHYEKLFGGFESLGEEEESDEEEVDPSMLTKEGYSKESGFVVDDEEDANEEYVPNDGDDSNEDLDGDEITDESELGEDDEGLGEDVEDDDDDDEDEEDEDEDECFSDDSGNVSELSEDEYL